MSWEAKILFLSQFVMSTRNKGIISKLVTCHKARSYKSGNLPKHTHTKSLINPFESIAHFSNIPFKNTPTNTAMDIKALHEA